MVRYSCSFTLQRFLSCDFFLSSYFANSVLSCLHAFWEMARFTSKTKWVGGRTGLPTPGSLWTIEANRPRSSVDRSSENERRDGCDAIRLLAQSAMFSSSDEFTVVIFQEVPLRCLKSDDRTKRTGKLRIGCSIDPGSNMEFGDDCLELVGRGLRRELRLRVSVFRQNGFFEFSGSQIRISLEGALERSQIPKAHFKSDVTDRLVSGLHDFDGLCHPKLSQPVCKSDSHLLAKESREVGFFRGCDLGGLLQ